MAMSLSSTYTGIVASVNDKGLKLDGHDDKAAREKARKRAHYLKNREAYLARAAAQRERLGAEAQAAYNREYRAQNAERLRAQRQEYYQRNRARIDAQNTAWKEAQGEQWQAYMRAYYQDRQQHHKARVAAWKRANPDHVKAWNTRRVAAKRTAPINDLTAAQWSALKRVYGHRCAYCGDLPDVLTMDHVVPLIRRGSHTASNILPACGPCNYRKNAGPPLPIVVVPLWSDLLAIFTEAR